MQQVLYTELFLKGVIDMQQVYAVLNPMDGQYKKHNSLEEAVAYAGELAVSFFLSHTHDQPLSVVDVNDDGSETWSSAYGQAGLSPEQVIEQLKNYVTQAMAAHNAGTIQTTTL